MNYNKIIEELSTHLDKIDSLSSSNEEDKEILDLETEASSYLLSHEWCDKISNAWLATSWGCFLCVFLYQIESDIPEVDDYVWIVVGDIPPAYIDIIGANQPNEVIESYVDIMTDWLDTVYQGKSVVECYPVEVPATKEYAKMLEIRLKDIAEELKNGT